MKTLELKHRLPAKPALLLIPLVLACVAFAPPAQATCQEGCLTNFNTVLGDDALISLTTGAANTAIGFEALFNNTGSFNTASGNMALLSNTNGFSNTAHGSAALASNTTGSLNTAIGYGALSQNTSGISNTAIGATALKSLTTGGDNTAIGIDTLNENTTGTGNIAVGAFAGDAVTGSNNIVIGNSGKSRESNTIRIGTTDIQRNTFIAGVSGVAVPDGVGVIIDARGHLGTAISSERFKEGIKPMDKASEAILALKPVTFRYKKEIDPDSVRQFGLVAEDVEKVNPDLVALDEAGKPYTVRYEAVNAMLLNEFLKEHRKNEQQQTTIERQQKQIDALTAAVQKVSAQLELSKSASQTVSNNH